MNDKIMKKKIGGVGDIKVCSRRIDDVKVTKG